MGDLFRQWLDKLKTLDEGLLTDLEKNVREWDNDPELTDFHFDSRGRLKKLYEYAVEQYQIHKTKEGLIKEIGSMVNDGHIALSEIEKINKKYSDRRNELKNELPQYGRIIDDLLEACVDNRGLTDESIGDSYSKLDVDVQKKIQEVADYIAAQKQEIENIVDEAVSKMEQRQKNIQRDFIPSWGV